jgi:hypothetical protein
VLIARAETAGIITAAEGATVIAARDLTAKVIRVDDFPQDFGASDMKLEALGDAPATTATTAVVQKAAA